MEAALSRFCELLRTRGVDVGLSQLLDAAAAVNVVGVQDRGLFREALRATLARSSHDLETFDEAFEEFFASLSRRLSQAYAAAGRAFGERYPEMLQALQEALSTFPQPVDPLLRALMTNQAAALSAMIARAWEAQAGGDGADPSLALYRLLRELGWGYRQREVEAFVAWLRRAVSAEDALRLESFLRSRLSQLHQVLRREVERAAGARAPSKHLILQKSFYSLHLEDEAELKRALSFLVRRLRRVATRRQQIKRRGRVDLRRTVARSAKHDGAPLELVLRARRRKRPQMIVLCDVSDSVRYATRFMLHFTYSLQDFYDRVRTFIFVADVGETTDLFRRCGADQAIEAIFRQEIIDVYTHTDYGEALCQFAQQSAGSLNRRTTVVILGDARSNYTDPRPDALAQIAALVKQLVWFTPEPAGSWHFGDCVIEGYRPYCHAVEEVRTVGHLYRAVEKHLIP